MSQALPACAPVAATLISHAPGPGVSGSLVINGGPACAWLIAGNASKPSASRRDDTAAIAATHVDDWPKGAIRGWKLEES
jgi:hypothetical protein